ncbi:MAG: sulfite exporter TauE/SafE family protein [Chloroflexota bacterium]
MIVSDQLWVILTFFSASILQGVSGFGIALIAIPLLVNIFGLKTAAPLMAGLGLFIQLVMTIRYRQSFNFSAVWRLTLASFCGIPLGIYLLSRVPEVFLLTILGVVTVLYALYRLFQLPIPGLVNKNWSLVFGGAAGLLAGAYSASGPPIVIYADSQRWTPDAFRSNVSGFFLLNTIVVNITHYLNGNITEIVWRTWLITVPFIFCGLLIGFYVNQFVNLVRFRQIVMVLLLVLGLRLILSQV